MKYTRAQCFYARDWLAWIWIVIFPALSALLMAVALGPAPPLGDFDADAKMYLTLLGISLLLGACVAALLGPFILGPIYHRRAVLNGYPYRPGDRVEILVGANRGCSVTVLEVRDWRGDLCVDPGGFVAPKGRTRFTYTEVMKTGEARVNIRVRVHFLI